MVKLFFVSPFIRFRPEFWYRLGSMFSVILLLYLIRKFPGLFGHPLTD